ncbi:tripartite tricarboxylate transporter substrate binding protein [Corticibacter populi]|uniref:Tripartite tricarboxylate transporter substrate binding protein n=1 Tax=Corticibacter populi TaxID=1550736 RepID=A0A3M6QY59_9BURK|nr:tripartite tricarboxylate transporter substrate binding protein [Corticibacter populi]RMX07955.1 tripartite tricarboxylate transporter substrate binding protein [Corticibacter populi]RZS35196.1 tripartite-type tricarboxylate transporter receptor subunit TctC [Corticibacter populi]
MQRETNRPARLAKASILSAAAALAMPLWAANAFPQSPIVLVVGFGAGGSTDVCNRALAVDVSRQLGQPLVVENRPGAGSSLSVTYTARQKPDGYTIAALSTGSLLNQVLTPSVKYDVTRDLTQIAMVAQYQVGVLVKADSPYQSMAELIEASKTAKQPLAYGTAGLGTPMHLASERLTQLAGTEWVHVPYKSGPENITALLRGDVDFMVQTAEWVPYVRNGSMRLLAAYTQERIKGFESAPTVRELGYDVVAPSFMGISGPAGMDTAVVQTLQEAFRNAVNAKEFVSCSDQFGLRPDFKDAAAFSAHVQDTLTTWTPLIKQLAPQN